MTRVSTRTQYKLEEARFFLAHLEKHWRQVPHVDFYISAFVSAARSVTWIMQAEFSKAPGWKEWYRSKEPPPEIIEFLKTINEVRVRAVHTSPIKTQTLANVTIPPEEITPQLLEFMENGSNGNIYLEPVDATNTMFHIKVGNQVLARAYLNSAEHHLPEFEGKDAKAVCQEYMEELEHLVEECLSTFKP